MCSHCYFLLVLDENAGDLLLTANNGPSLEGVAEIT